MSRLDLYTILTGYPSPCGHRGTEARSTSIDTDGDRLSRWNPRDEDWFKDRTAGQLLPVAAWLLEQFDRSPERVRARLHGAFGWEGSEATLRCVLEAALQAAWQQVGEDDLPELLELETAPQEDGLACDLAWDVPEDFCATHAAAFIDARLRHHRATIALDAASHRFEPDHLLGRIGWVLFGGPAALRVPRAGVRPNRERLGRLAGARLFRRHGDDDFIYPLASRSDGSTAVALLGGMATGLGHARYIARQLEVDPYQAAVHLGGVGYAATNEEYRHHLLEPLAAARRSGTELFVVPHSHDGYSGFQACSDFFDRRDVRQQGSYFALRSSHIQFLAVDTVWHSQLGRIQDARLRRWLGARLVEGRELGLTNVLLTGHHPLEYGRYRKTGLHADVMEVAAGRLDLWFWAETPYCALYGPRKVHDPARAWDAIPYIGSSIGHAGSPYPRLADPPTGRHPTRLLWAETGSRYEPSRVRSDRGMNGFCALEVDAAGAIRLRYRDWRGHDRCIVHLARSADGSVVIDGPVQDTQACAAAPGRLRRALGDG